MIYIQIVMNISFLPKKSKIMLYKNILVALSLSIGFIPMHGMYTPNRQQRQQRRLEQLKIKQQEEQNEDQQNLTESESIATPATNDTWSSWAYNKAFGATQSIKNTVDSWGLGMKHAVLAAIVTALIHAHITNPEALAENVRAIAEGAAKATTVAAVGAAGLTGANILHEATDPQVIGGWRNWKWWWQQLREDSKRAEEDTRRENDKRSYKKILAEKGMTDNQYQESQRQKSLDEYKESQKQKSQKN